MSGHTLNFIRWLDRMGLKRADAPDLIYGLQPVQIVSDASDSVSKVFAPSGLVGGNQAAVAAEFTMFKFTVKVPTRIVVGAGPTTWRITTGVSTPFATGPAALTPQNFDPSQPLTGIYQVGTTVIGPAISEPQFGAGLGTPGMYEEIWIPAGGTLDVISNTLNDKASCWARLVETPAIPSD